MADIVLTLRSARDEALDTTTFVFEAEGLGDHVPGQYLLLKLDVPEDPRRGSRSFTIANAPSGGRVTITSRMRPSSLFKRGLAALHPGAQVSAKGPLGRFVMPEGDTPALLLAGGIGVTPFRAMLEHAIASGRSRPVTLVVSDRVPEASVYREEIDRWASEHAWLKVVRTVTRPSPGLSPWRGRTGRIDAALLREALPSPGEGVALVAGPPAFVDGIVAVLAALGLPPDRVRSERFIGY